MALRPYQHELKASVQAAWEEGARNVVLRLDTGGGKTVILSSLIAECRGAVAVIAHRQELVGQLSLALARNGLRHNLIAPSPVRRAIADTHIREVGRSFYSPGSPVAVASIDTLARAPGLDAWAAQVQTWVVDEGHHVVAGNKWQKALERFTHPELRGLLPTATPGRADGLGLGRPPVGAGVADAMVEGPPMQWLIEQGYLSPYRLYCPASDLQVLASVGASGDWSPKQLKEAAEKSRIVGDVVEAYQRWGAGRLGVTFATDLATATAMAAQYNAAGIPAEVLSGKTEGRYRREVLRRFSAREFTQIVAVDIISEGFDLPAIEVASLARPTQSLALYMQQFGRALRPSPGKVEAIIIDHAGNTLRHQGPPDVPRVWTLASRESRRGAAKGAPLLRVCEGCASPYERFLQNCPFCGEPRPAPADRSSPEAVDGDLAEMDPALLASLRAKAAEAAMSVAEYKARLAARGCPPAGVAGHGKRHAAALEARAALAEAMEAYADRALGRGLKDREVHRAFYLQFGVDVLTAQALAKEECEALTERIKNAPA